MGGIVKQLAARSSLQRPTDQQITTAEELFHWAEGAFHNVQFQYVTREEVREEVREEEKLLQDRIEAAVTVTGTQKFNSFLPVLGCQDKFNVCVYSNEETGRVVKVGRLTCD